MIEQKIVALIALLVGVLMPIVNDWDVTFSIIMIPIGLFFLFTKKRIIK